MAYYWRRPDATPTAANPIAASHLGLLAPEARVITTVKSFLASMLILMLILVVGILIWNFAMNFQARP